MIIFSMQTESIMLAHWPSVPEVDIQLLKESEYFTATVHELRIRLKKMNEKVQAVI